MKQKNEKFIKIIEKELLEKKYLTCEAEVNEIIKMFKEKEIDDKLEYDTLVELCKYIKIGNTITSIDPRGDRYIKIEAINGIRKSINEGNLSQKDINFLKEVNKICLSYFLNPLDYVEKKEDFYKKHPNARF